MVSYKLLNKLVNEVASERKVQFLKDRNYKIPKGYRSWDNLANALVLLLESFVLQDYSSIDVTGLLNYQYTALWYIKDYPVYLLSKELYKAFTNTDVISKNKLLTTEVPVNGLLVLFPENMVLDPAGNPIDYVILHCLKKGDIEAQSGQLNGVEVKGLAQESPLNISWVSVTIPGEITWHSGYGVTEEGDLIHTAENIGGMLSISEEDNKFLEHISNVCFQILLTLEYRKELITPEKRYEPRNKYDKTPIWRMPRILGKDFKIQSEVKGESGDRNSPRSHWRIGHWRRVVSGKRENNERKWVWIEPVYVGAKKNEL